MNINGLDPFPIHRNRQTSELSRLGMRGTRQPATAKHQTSRGGGIRKKTPA
jgi:hypothetical protein